MFKAKNRAPKSVAEKHIPKNPKKLRRNTNSPMPKKIPLRNLLLATPQVSNQPLMIASSSLMENKERTSSLTILLRPMIKHLMIWQHRDLQTRKSNTCKTKSKTRMEHTLILMTQLNTRKPERDFKTENLLLEADKERRATRKSLRMPLTTKTRSLIN